MEKGGQLKISFGMIFSIFLIIIFIAFAFYAITKFLDFQNVAKLGRFQVDLQKDVDNIWKSPQGSQRVNYLLPAKIKKICLMDIHGRPLGMDNELYSDFELVSHGEANLFFYPIGSGIDSFILQHIDLEKVTQMKNPLCFDVVKGRVEMQLKMSYGEKLVSINA